MDNLKTLMDKKEYELVIKLTENSVNPNDIFYRISALLATGKIDESLKVLESKQKLLENNLSVLSKVHVEILCLLGRFNEARHITKYYQNLPYQSQVTEEVLNSLPELINAEERKGFSFKTLNNDQIIEKLLSKNDQEVLLALDTIRDRDILTFLPYIKKVMVDFPKQSIRSFALLLLVQKETDRELLFNHCGKQITVNPKHLEPPFVGEDFNQIIKAMQTEYKDPSLGEHAVSILSSYLLYIYPDKIAESNEILLTSLYLIALSYLGADKDFDADKYIEEKGLDKEEVHDLVEKINISLEDF